MKPSFTINLDQTIGPNAEAKDVRHSMNADSAMAASFCLMTGLELASLSVQASSPLPLDLYPFSLMILLAFSFLMLGNFALPPKHLATAFVFDRFGVVFAVTAFFIGVAAPFPLWVKCVAWVTYTFTLVAAVAASNLPAVLRRFICISTFLSLSTKKTADRPADRPEADTAHRRPGDDHNPTGGDRQQQIQTQEPFSGVENKV